MNPFIRAKFIRLGYDEEVGFTIDIETRNGTSVHLICGMPETAASIMLVNNVQHFDFKDSVMNHTSAAEDWKKGAATVGFDW